jgi:hypothetical protein
VIANLILLITQWAKIDLQLGDDGVAFAFGNGMQQISDQIFLPALSEHHAVDGEGATQIVKAFLITAIGQVR